jgi:hypothetical protein
LCAIFDSLETTPQIVVIDNYTFDRTFNENDEWGREGGLLLKRLKRGNLIINKANARQFSKQASS